jgi:TorA maturation chaperone TorD
MRAGAVEEAVNAAGGVGALARALGISQPAVSSWNRIPADRVIAVEAITGIARSRLRPDLYSAMSNPETRDDVDVLRAHEYNMLAALLGRAPGQEILAALATIKGDGSILGQAHAALASAAANAQPDALQNEFFNLFIGVGRGELLPYASYYLTGFLNERPLARVRGDLINLGIERAENQYEPEDHIAVLFETMAGLAAGQFPAEPGAEKRFFERHIQPWAERFFIDLEAAPSARFYRSVAALGRLFMEVEAEAFAMDA